MFSEARVDTGIRMCCPANLCFHTSLYRLLSRCGLHQTTVIGFGLSFHSQNSQNSQNSSVSHVSFAHLLASLAKVWKRCRDP